MSSWVSIMEQVKIKKTRLFAVFERIPTPLLRLTFPLSWSFLFSVWRIEAFFIYAQAGVWGIESDPAVTKKYWSSLVFCSLGATVDLTTVAHRAKLLFSRQYMQNSATHLYKFRIKFRKLAIYIFFFLSVYSIDSENL